MKEGGGKKGIKIKKWKNRRGENTDEGEKNAKKRTCID